MIIDMEGERPPESSVAPALTRPELLDLLVAATGAAAVLRPANGVGETAPAAEVVPRMTSPIDLTVSP